MLTVEYDPNGGTPVSDGNCEVVASKLLGISRDPDVARHFGPKYSTENVFYALMLLVKEKKISHTAIRFKFRDKFINIRENGQTENSYADFLGYSQKKLLGLL